MRRVITLICLILVGLCSLYAQQSATDPPASRDDILRLFEVMHIRQQMHLVMEQVSKQTMSMSREQIRKIDPNVSDEEMAKLDAMSVGMLKRMPIDGILDDMIPVYQKHLTKTDVDAMAAFYSSATGQKILNEMPAITAEGMQAMQPRMKKIMDDMTRDFEKMAREQLEKRNAKPDQTKD